MTDFAFLLEDGTGKFLLEDGSGVWLLEEQEEHAGITITQPSGLADPYLVRKDRKPEQLIPVKFRFQLIANTFRRIEIKLLIDERSCV